MILLTGYTYLPKSISAAKSGTSFAVESERESEASARAGTEAYLLEEGGRETKGTKRTETSFSLSPSVSRDLDL